MIFQNDLGISKFVVRSEKNLN